MRAQELASLREEERLALAGGKAASLAWLQAEGFPVPPFAVLSTQLLDRFLQETRLQEQAERLLAETGTQTAAGSPDLEARLAGFERCLREVPWPAGVAAAVRAAGTPLLAGGPLAVRSSGVYEDLAAASFAGQYRSVLHVADPESLLAAVRDCWAAACSARVLHYAAAQGIRLRRPSLAVILQRQVAARCAGVAFSVDPVGGADDEVLIEACEGLGDALVDGRVSPERYRWAWRRDADPERVSPGNREVLSAAEVVRLGRLVVEVQARQGRPVDVEWAWDDQGPWLLQSRPVTCIAVRAVPGAWTTADLKDGGVSARVTTPLMASLYEAVFSRTLPEYLDGIGLRAAREETLPWMRRAFGRLYWNVGRVKSRLAALPGFCERDFDEDLGVAPAYEGDGRCTSLTPGGLLRGLRVLWSIPRAAARCLERDRRGLPGWHELLRSWEEASPGALQEGELRRRLAALLGEVHPEVEGAYFRTIYNVSNSQTLFRDRLRGRLGRETAGEVLLHLLSGLQDLSHLRAWREEDELVQCLRREPGAVRVLVERCAAETAGALARGEDFPGSALLRQYLARHAHLGPATLDLLVPRWGEDPTPLLEAVRARLRGGGEEAPGAAGEQQQACAQAAKERVLGCLRGPLGPWRRRRFRRSLDRLRALLWWREEMRMLSTRVYAQVRRWTLAWGRLLAVRGEIEAAEDLFFLEQSQLLEWLLRGYPPPGHRRAVRRARLYADGFRCFRNPDELGSWVAEAPAAATGTGALRGIPGSAGVACGRATVLRDLDEAGRLRPGDVLVTAFTDPGWTHLFGGLAAVVTETGGMLSHAAVIARECGFPAVLGLTAATRRIPEGALLEVDGSRGEVRIVERA